MPKVGDEWDLMGLPVPAPPEDEAATMARCFVEEFVRMGWDDSQILAVFASPFYRGPHWYYRNHGGEAVRRLLGAVRRALCSK